MSDNENEKIFQDTMECIRQNELLGENLSYSLQNERLYLEGEEVSVPDSAGDRCNVVVSKKRSFEAARDYAKAGKKVCVLNFASSVNPGGGVVHGASAQEECLCRCSTLYPCLDVKVLWEKFYLPHRELDGGMYNDDCIYTPDVTVFKSDVALPERLPENEWYKVDVITCAAPNLRDEIIHRGSLSGWDIEPHIPDEEVYDIHVKRIDRIFRIAIANHAEVLILGAFGCGAFCNPPKVVSKAFKEVQSRYEKYFDVIEYAVYSSQGDRANYVAFCDTFGAQKEYDLTRFLVAHEENYTRALAEVKQGQKRTHWMWFIFPQLLGLGISRRAIYYSIFDIDEAKAYMSNRLLAAHLNEICEALLELDTCNVDDVFGYPDNMKLKSSMTLFEKVEPDNELFGKVLDKFYAGERDEKTLNIIG